MMERNVNVGIIGCGGIAEGKHLPAIKNTPSVSAVAFCDFDGSRAAKVAREYGAENAKAFTDYKELLKEPDIEAVHILTPNKYHSEMTVAALEAGKHVICEKPMAINTAEAQLMVDAQKRTGKILMVAYQNRMRPDAQYLKKACEAGDLGEIYFAKAHAIRRRAVPTWGVFTNEELQGGGPLIDIGTHALDLTLWMMNNYKPRMVVGSVFKKLGKQTQTGNAWGDWDTQSFNVEDSAFGFVVMENGATVILESSWALNTLEIGEAKTTLCGTKAGADMRDGLRFNSAVHGKLTITKPQLSSDGVDFFDGKTEEPGDLEVRVFYDAIRKGRPLVVEPEQALCVTKILEAIYESSKIGKPVYFD